MELTSRQARFVGMPRYFFHLCNGTGLIEDEEGQELTDESSAREIAIKEARNLMSEEMRQGELNVASFIEVQNERGEYLFTLPFEEAFRVTRHH